MAVIAGNWKMHNGPADAAGFLTAFDTASVSAAHELIVFPPAVSLYAVASSPDRDPRLQVGVQNVHWEDAGAFTGETSAEMAVGAGATFSLIGHSERRHVFGESDEDTRRKVEASLRAGLVPVLCVGETIDERRAGAVETVILRQLDAALDVLRHADRFLVAYEPVWAIGTGETATPEQAQEVHSALRAMAAKRSAKIAADLRLLYGGSMKPSNAADLLAMPDIDGGLIGGASLEAGDFLAVCRAAVI